MTTATYVGSDQVIYPVTPNGVEHDCRFSSQTSDPRVIYPVTPNGVEHLYQCEKHERCLVCDLSGNA